MIAPSNILPEFQTLDSQNDTIIISWKSNMITQYGFDIFFYDNSDDTLLFDTGLVVSSISTYTLPSGSIAVGKEIKYYIKQYADSTTSIDSEYILIKTALKPSVTIDTLPTTTESFEFVATTTLAANTTVQKYRFLLYDNFLNQIYDSGYIIDYVPRHEIVGLLPNFPYRIQAEIIDSNDQKTTSALVPFQITQTSSTVSLFTLTAIDNAATVQIDFTPISQSIGTVSGDYSFVDGKFGQGLSLSNGGFVRFDKTVADTFAASMYRKLPIGFVGDIVSFGNNELVVFYTGERFGYRMGDFITVGSLCSLPNPAEFIKIIIKYGKVIVQTLTYTEVI